MNRGQNISDLSLVSNNTGNVVSIGMQGGNTVLIPTHRYIPMTFAALPNTSVATAGMVRAITDSTTQVWGASVTAGGGALYALLNYNGTDWTVIGK